MQIFPFCVCQANRKIHEAHKMKHSVLLEIFAFVSLTEMGRETKTFFVIWVFACHSNKIVAQGMD